MSEISERADDLIIDYGKARQDCGRELVETWHEKNAIKARQALADYIASLESQLAERDALIARLVDAGSRLLEIPMLYDGSGGYLVSDWHALVTECRASKDGGGM